MKKTLLPILLVSLLFTSCLKDGFNDFEALKHPLAISGTVSPTLGVPVAQGSATIFDMLKMVQISHASMEVNENGILTIAYDTSNTWHIDVNNSKRPRKSSSPKSGEVVHIWQKTIDGHVSVDLFKNIQGLENAELEVENLMLNVNAYIKAQANQTTEHALDSFHVQVYYDSLYIDVIGKDNTHTVIPLNDSVPIDSLIIGQNIKLFDDYDISSTINHRPVEIRYGARMNIAFEAEFFSSGISESDFVVDSLGINSVDINADIKVRFPMTAYINNLDYETDIDFAPSFSFRNLTIDSSMLMLKCDNSIPLSLLLRAQLVDSNDVVLCDLLDPIMTEVEGADVTYNSSINMYVSTNPKETLVRIPVTASVYNALLKTQKIRLKATLNTSATNNTTQNRVAIQASDKLKLLLTAKIKPSYELDINLENNDNDEEGGEK